MNVLGDATVTPVTRVGHTMVPDDEYSVWIFGGEVQSGVLAEADLYKLDTARCVIYVYTYVHAYDDGPVRSGGRLVTYVYTYVHTYDDGPVRAGGTHCVT